MKKTGKTIKQLIKRIHNDLGIECDPETFHRTYRGYWAKRASEWSWDMQTADHKYNIGSIYTATEILKSKNKLVIFSEWGSTIEICPDE